MNLIPIWLCFATTVGRCEVPVWTTSISPDGRYLAAGVGIRSSDDRQFGQAVVWESKNGQYIEVFRKRFDYPVFALSFSNHGSIAIGYHSIIKGTPGSPDNGIRVLLWDCATRKELSVLESQPDGGYIWQLAFSPDSRKLAVGRVGAPLFCFEVESRKRIFVTEGHISSHLCFSPDGKELMSCSSNPTEIRHYNTEMGTLTKLAKVKWGIPDWSQIMPDRNVAVASFNHQEVRILDSTLENTVGRFRLGSAKNVAVTSNVEKGMLAVASDDGIVNVIKFQDGTPLSTLECKIKRVNCLAFSPDGKVVAVAAGRDGADAAIEGFFGLFDTISGKLIARLK